MHDVKLKGTIYNYHLIAAGIESVIAAQDILDCFKFCSIIIQNKLY